MNGHLFRIHKHTPGKCAKFGIRRADARSLFTHSLHHFFHYSHTHRVSLDEQRHRRKNQKRKYNESCRTTFRDLNGMCFSTRIYQCFKWIVVLCLCHFSHTVSIHTSFSPRFVFRRCFFHSFVLQRSIVLSTFHSITRCKLFAECPLIPFCWLLLLSSKIVCWKE